jgi:drug/metabolite transporter (DMT)-like permease
MNKWILLLLLALLWAPSFIFIRIGLNEFPPLTMATLRLGLASIILYVTLRIGGGTLPKSWDTWKKMLTMGFLACALPYAMFATGELHAPSAMAAILNGTTPIFTAIFAHIFIAEERLTPRKLLGAAIAFSGILLIFLPGLLGNSGASGSLFGLAEFLVAAISYGASLVYGRKNLRGLPPMVGPTTQLMGAAAMLLPVALVTERIPNHMPALPSIGAVLFLAVFGTAIAYVLYYKILVRTSATFLSLVTYLLPPSGAFLSVMVLDEELGWNAIAGCALVIAGIFAINNVFARRRVPEEPAIVAKEEAAAT